MRGGTPAILAKPIETRILFLRDQRVMLDADLAAIYGVSTRVLNQAVKRNRDRFPEDFMFRLTEPEKVKVITACDHLRPLRFSPSLPHTFTEHGAKIGTGHLFVAKPLNSWMSECNSWRSARKWRWRVRRGKDQRTGGNWQGRTGRKVNSSMRFNEVKTRGENGGKGGGTPSYEPSGGAADEVKPCPRKIKRLSSNWRPLLFTCASPAAPDGRWAGAGQTPKQHSPRAARRMP
jgi:hypothetical protein